MSTVQFDAQQKIWSCPPQPYLNGTPQSMGAAFLKAMRSATDSDRILEYYYDIDVERSAYQIYVDAVTVAKNLQRLGVQKGDIVSFYSLSNVQITPLMFGCFLIGAIVNILDVTFTPAHLDHTLKLLKPTVILYEYKYAAQLHAALSRCSLEVAHVLSINSNTTPNVHSELFRNVTVEEISNFQHTPIVAPDEENALLLMTSGSTGPPKVVQLTHAAFLHGLRVWWSHPSAQLSPDCNSVIFCFSALRWIGHVALLCQAVLFGWKRIAVSGLPAGAYGRELVRKCGVTHFFTAPPVFLDVLRETSDIDALKTLQIALLGGEPTASATYELAQKYAVNCKIFQCYGMTELAGAIANDEGDWGGHLTAGMELKIVDERLQPLGAQEYGLVCLRAPAHFKGYFGQDNLKYFTEDGFFISGDYGYVDAQGRVQLKGRYSELIHTMFATLIPSDIEKTVNKLPEVAATQLVGCKLKPEDSYDIAVLFVVLHSTVTANENYMRQKIYEHLKRTIPADELSGIDKIHFENQLPRSTCGKADRQTLKVKAMSLQNTADCISTLL